MRRALNHYEKLFEEMVRDASESTGSNEESSSGTGDTGDAETATTVTYDNEVRPIRPS